MSNKTDEADMTPKARRTLVPELRFPEFTDAGEWEEKVLAQVCEINPPTKDLPDYFIYIDLESVEAGKLAQEKVISLKEAPSRAQRLLKRGDVLFQTVRPYQKNNYFFQPNNDLGYVASTGYAQLRARESNMYLFQYLHNDRFVARVLAKCTGSNYPAINSSDLSEITIEIPNFKEQQKIADCLSSVDELITLEARKIDALKAHKKGLMQQLFPAEGETLPELRFPEFRDAGEWEEKVLGEIGKIVTGKTPSTTDKSLWGGEIQFVTPTDMTEEKYQTKTQRTVVNSPSLAILPPKTVMFTCIASIGKMALSVLPCVTNQQINSVLPNKGFENEFVYYALLKASSQIKSKLASTTLPIINKTEFSQIPIFIASKDEQRKIADCLSSIDDLITLEAQKLNALKAHKKGLLQQLFPSLDEVR